MTTMEGRKGEKPDLQDCATTMAVAIIVERIINLSKEDKDDLYELMKEMPRAETEDEINEIGASMVEILDQAVVALHRINGSEGNESGAGLQNWMRHYGAKIKEYREAASMTQLDLAAKSGLPQSHISRLEAGKHSPSQRTLIKIADALGITLRDLDPSAD